MPERLEAYGWDKPYLITEGGPRGPWETIKTSWGASIEPSSTAKASDYLSGFQAAVGEQAQCLGGYMYFWGVQPNITAAISNIREAKSNCALSISSPSSVWPN